MDYAEAVFTIDQLSKPMINPSPVSDVEGEWDGNSILIISMHTNDAVINNVKNVKTIAVEVWRRKSSRITEYGQGTKLGNFNVLNDYIEFEDDYSELEMDDIYYYAIFSIGSNGLINKFDIAEYEFDSTNPYGGIIVWGFMEDFNITDPTPGQNRITYPKTLTDPDSLEVIYTFKNYNYTPMSVTQTIYMQSGNFKNFLTNVLKNKPYMVSNATKRADYELDPLDYTKKLDGSASDFNNTSYSGGPFAWVELPLIKEIYEDYGTYGRRIVMWCFDRSKFERLREIGWTDILVDGANSNAVLNGVWIPMGFLSSGYKINGGVTPLSEISCDGANTYVTGFRSDAKYFGGPIIHFLRDVGYMLFKTPDLLAYAGYGRYNTTDAIPIQNQVVNGSGYTYNNTSIYDLEATGFQGCTDSTKNVPGKMFHSYVLGQHALGYWDAYTATHNKTVWVTKNYIFNRDNYTDTNIQGCAEYSTNICPIKMKKTIAGSIPDISSNLATESTGTCSGTVGYFNTGDSRWSTWCRDGKGSRTHGIAGASAWTNPSGSYSAYPHNGVTVMLLPDSNYSPTV